MPYKPRWLIDRDNEEKRTWESKYTTTNKTWIDIRRAFRENNVPQVVLFMDQYV